MFKVCVVIGARPNYIKAWPILKKILSSDRWKLHLVHSGQHYDKNLSENLLNELQFPKINTQLSLANKINASSRYSALHNNFKTFFRELRFDAVIVFGDVNTTVAATLAAKNEKQYVVHVESGLRSFDVTMPEEINRIIVDNWSDLLVTTEASANENLKSEGFDHSKIAYCGNPMIETLIRNSHLWKKEKNVEPYILSTIHRAETIHSRQNLSEISMKLLELSLERRIVLPLHPATKSQLDKFNLKDLTTAKNIEVVEPLTYLEFLNFMWNSDGILTDSGGVQEEAVFMKKKVVTLRPNTERPSTLDTGLNILMPLKEFSVEACLNHFLNTEQKHYTIPFWDENVAERILQNLENRIL